MGPWIELLETYEKINKEAPGSVTPIAHTKVNADIGVLLSDDGHFCGAMQITGIRETIPCTIDSESRTSDTSPHPIHDNITYLAQNSKYSARHIAYMGQLSKYVQNTSDPLATAVYNYLRRGTLLDDISELLKIVPNPEKAFVIFTTKNHKSCPAWTDYHLSTLPINGICSITGNPDHIPAKYPRDIRFPGDKARLFQASTKEVDGIVQAAPGYIATQKIIHTLQALIYDINISQKERLRPLLFNILVFS